MSKARLALAREVRRTVARRHALLNAGPEAWVGALQVQAKRAAAQQARVEKRFTRTGSGPPLEEAGRRALEEQIRLAEWAAWFWRFLGGHDTPKPNRAMRRGRR